MQDTKAKEAARERTVVELGMYMRSVSTMKHTGFCTAGAVLSNRPREGFEGCFNAMTLPLVNNWQSFLSQLDQDRDRLISNLP